MEHLVDDTIILIASVCSIKTLSLWAQVSRRYFTLITCRTTQREPSPFEKKVKDIENVWYSAFPLHNSKKEANAVMMGSEQHGHRFDVLKWEYSLATRTTCTHCSSPLFLTQIKERLSWRHVCEEREKLQLSTERSCFDRYRGWLEWVSQRGLHICKDCFQRKLFIVYGNHRMVWYPLLTRKDISGLPYYVGNLSRVRGCWTGDLEFLSHTRYPKQHAEVVKMECHLQELKERRRALKQTGMDVLDEETTIKKAMAVENARQEWKDALDACKERYKVLKRKAQDELKKLAKKERAPRQEPSDPLLVERRAPPKRKIPRAVGKRDRKKARLY